MELVVVERDTGVELDATECAEVAGPELVDGTDLSSGRGRWMERIHDGRHEYGRSGAGERLGWGWHW
jgi:hypothetical protein